MEGMSEPWVSGVQILVDQSPFYLVSSAKSDFVVRLLIVPHAGCNFWPLEELPPHAKNDKCGY